MSIWNYTMYNLALRSTVKFEMDGRLFRKWADNQECPMAFVDVNSNFYVHRQLSKALFL